MNRFGLTDSNLKKILDVFKKFISVENVILYGSRAKGNYRIGSDIDLTLKGKGLELSTLYKIEDQLDDLMLPYKIDLSIYSNINNQNLIEHIDRVGVDLLA